MGSENSKAPGPPKEPADGKGALHCNSADSGKPTGPKKRSNTCHGSDENKTQTFDSKALLSQFRDRLKTGQGAKQESIESIKHFNPQVDRALTETLKSDVMKYVEKKYSSESEEQDHFYGEISNSMLRKLPANKFTEALHLMFWQITKIDRNSEIFKEQPSVLQKIGSFRQSTR